MIDNGYVVFDEASENVSKLYHTLKEAQADLEGDITHKWSSGAVIVEVDGIEEDIR